MNPDPPDPNAIFPPPKSGETQPERKPSSVDTSTKASERRILLLVAIVLVWMLSSHFFMSPWITPLSLPVGFVYAIYVSITPEKHPPWVRNLAKAIVFASLALLVLFGILVAICSHTMKF